MLNANRLLAATLVAALLAPAAVHAQPATAPDTADATDAPATQPVPVAEVEGFETFSARASYMAGLQLGGSLATYDIELDDEMLLRGVREGAKLAQAEADAAANPDAPAIRPTGDLTDAQLQEMQFELSIYFQQKRQELQQKAMEEQQRAMEEQQEAMKEVAKAARVESKKFLDENAERDEIQVTETGLQYAILKKGEGGSPKATDLVTMHMAMGKPGERPSFNTRDQGAPTPVPVETLPLAGWVEALQLLSPGGTGKFYLPPDLAFGDQGMAQFGIGPGEVVEMEIELITVEAPPEDEAAVAPADEPGEAKAPATQPGE